MNIASEEVTNPIGLPWGEVLIGAIGFALLLVVLGKFVWPMFEKAFAARTKAIEGGIAKAEEAQNEAKAALDAIINRWSAERTWAERVTLAHALIGWVRGTGLMGGNDPLVEAVEAAGVRTWSTDEMAGELLKLVGPEATRLAAEAPLVAISGAP